MPARKRTPEKVWQLTFDIFYLGMPLIEAAKLNGISRAVANTALKKDAITYGYITPEQYTEYLRNAYLRGYKGLKNSLGTEEGLKTHYADMGLKSASNGLERLTEQAMRGGLETQKRHGKKVAKNLKHAKQYGSSGCKYGDTWFASKGERVTALLLKSYNLIDAFVEGQNFQKDIGRFTVDFYINDKLIIEYHPIPKQKFHSREVEVPASIEAYAKDRTEALKNHFNGKVVAIPAPSGTFSATEFYKRMNDMGINDTWSGFLKKCREVHKSIDLFEKQYALELNNIKPEDDVPF